MLLAFDVGNTNIVLGVYRGRDLVQYWRMETNHTRSADEYGMFIRQLFDNEGLSMSDINDVIIATVVPSISYTLQHLSQKYFGCRAIIVGPGIRTGLVVKYDNPKTLGADRIVNSVAAAEKYPAPLIVIDYGTATTFCAISDKKEYLGGVIVPGIKISSDALFERTARLPKVEIDTPEHVICRNTVECIQSGVVYGNMGMTEYIVQRMKKEICDYIGEEKKVTVVATGGLSTLMSSGISCIDHVDKLLTLTGLQIIYEKNRQNPAGKNAKQGYEDY